MALLRDMCSLQMSPGNILRGFNFQINMCRGKLGYFVVTADHVTWLEADFTMSHGGG